MPSHSPQDMIRQKTPGHIGLKDNIAVYTLKRELHETLEVAICRYSKNIC